MGKKSIALKRSKNPIVLFFRLIIRQAMGALGMLKELPHNFAREVFLVYPKFSILVLTFMITYILFSRNKFLVFSDILVSWGYLGVFLNGILFTYSFTAAPSTGVFLLLAKTQNPYMASLLGGFGALIGDLLIFRLIRVSFADEIKKLQNERIFSGINHHTPQAIKAYALPVVAALIIASPLPDEIGVSMLAASPIVSTRLFSLISFVLNTFGILLILKIGTLI